ncbi:hypothetical protein IDG47_09710 [Staphylococcus sp. EG-SA-6]|uniref:hypothetical protein n=1 Tax=Staphylococcus TaxID=1279 RepID=UPI0004B6ED3C|nr:MULTISPECIES: hypothetical protein [Staphylococcus]MBN4933012.1 hypothetical protein [Staphylococcus sp. EG-SA-6]AVP11493.1 hypothetical protein FORC59_1835 [Staphylococcus aureus]EGQ1569536.1 hypothetical protein [Staphylococcus aureus]EGQ1574878.1 hypothetical protein [Staphylococcus aureus]EGQ1583162.1 hypothetical protein [Staphylococcus aureus]
MFSKYIDNSKNKDESYKSIDEIIDNILNYDKWLTPTIDPYTGDQLTYIVEKAFEMNKEVKIKGETFTFNLLSFKYDSLITGFENSPIYEERVKQTNGYFIIYTDGSRTQYIINRGTGSNALSILRKINNSESNKIIEAKTFSFNSDFFIWLISKFKNDNNIDENENITLERVTGFKGSGNANQATLIGAGNDVMNLFSTMSFIIEMDSLTEILAKFKYNEHTIEIRFYESNSQIDINIAKYTGEYLREAESLKNSLILLHSFILIIPAVINSFNNDEWNKEKEKKFSQETLEAVKIKIKKAEKMINE